MKVQFKKCHDLAIIPKYAHSTDSGMDLFSVEEDITFFPSQIKVIKTGLQVILPSGYEAQIRPKSGLSTKGLVAVLGTVDNGYRGEISVIVQYTGNTMFKVSKLSKIAQIVIQKVESFEVEEVFEIDDKTSRGQGGFGSTGLINSEVG